MFNILLILVIYTTFETEALMSIIVLFGLIRLTAIPTADDSMAMVSVGKHSINSPHLHPLPVSIIIITPNSVVVSSLAHHRQQSAITLRSASSKWPEKARLKHWLLSCFQQLEQDSSTPQQRMQERSQKN